MKANQEEEVKEEAINTIRDMKHILHRNRKKLLKVRKISFNNIYFSF